MATFTKTVDPNGGSDYLSLALWEAGEQTLYSSGDIARAVCKRTGATKDTSSTTIFGWTTGVIPEITVDPLYRHEGKIADTRVSDGNYIYIVTNGSAANLRPAEPNIVIDGLLIQPTSNQVGIQNAGGNLNDISKNWYVRRCIVDGGTASTGRGIDNSSGASTLYAQNCVVTNFDGASVGYAISAQGTSRRAYIQNCTLFNNRFGATAVSSGQVICENTIALDNFAGDYLSPDAASNFNVSSDATAPGATSATLKTSYATYFVDHLNGDFHLTDTSGTLFGIASADLSATFTDDIDGDTRPSDSTFGLGADFFVASGITGTGSHQATTATHSATGERTITGSASHSAQTATHSATGEREITGIAAHVASTATHSASGTVGSEITGSASHQAQTSTHAATGERQITGTASHSAQTATHTAIAERIVTGIAAHVANTATHSASGSVGNVVSGTGTHSANDATHSATGLRVITGSASHQAETATHSATGNVAGQITGTAAHQAQRATSTGVILRVITGTASHQAATATQAATDIPLISLPLGPFTVSDITPKRGILDTTNINSILKLG